MTHFLQRLSGFCFYLLGTSFIVAWVMLKQNLYGTEEAVWMQSADLPLIFSGLVYGGLSLYLSLRHPEEPSTLLAWMIGVPLGAFFGLLLLLNFWPS